MADLSFPGYNEKIECPDDHISFYADLLGDYGPSCRLVFFVREEQDIMGRIAIVEGMAG